MSSTPNRRPSYRLQQWIFAVGFALTGFIWPVFGGPEMVMAYLTSRSLDEPRAITSLAAWLGPFFLFVIIFGLWYQRWMRTSHGALAKVQVEKISKARKALLDAVEFLDMFTATIANQSEKVEQLQTELASLKNLNKETTDELKAKLSAIEIINRGRT